MIKFTYVRQEVILKIGRKDISTLFSMYIKKSKNCHISFGSTLIGVVPNQKWKGLSFFTPTETRLGSAKYVTLNDSIFSI